MSGLCDPLRRFEDGDLLTIKQARRILPVSQSRMYELVAAGEVPAIRVPSAGGGRGRWLVVRSGLDRYIRARLRDRPTRPLVETPDSILARIERKR
jgi:excisionase family DNA binding protein